MPDIKLIAAVDNKRGIAKQGKIPWNLPGDKAFYRQQITTAPSVMGWITYAAHGAKPGTPHNYVLTHREIDDPNVTVIRDLRVFLQTLTFDVWVIGGGEIYSQALPFATHLYLTQIDGDFECDVFFPAYEESFHRVEQSEPLTENGTSYRFEIWRPNH